MITLRHIYWKIIQIQYKHSWSIASYNMHRPSFSLSLTPLHPLTHLLAPETGIVLAQLTQLDLIVPCVGGIQRVTVHGAVMRL